MFKSMASLLNKMIVDNKVLFICNNDELKMVDDILWKAHMFLPHAIIDDTKYVSDQKLLLSDISRARELSLDSFNILCIMGWHSECYALTEHFDETVVLLHSEIKSIDTVVPQIKELFYTYKYIIQNERGFNVVE